MLRERVIKILREGVPGYREEIPVTRQVDSLALVHLVDALEHEFKIKIASMEIASPSFDSVSTIEDLVARKRGEAG